MEAFRADLLFGKFSMSRPILNTVPQRQIPDSVHQHNIITRLRRNLNRDGLDRSAGDDGAGMRRPLRYHNQCTRLDFAALIADPHLAGAFDNVLDLVGVGMIVLGRVAGLQGDGGVVGDDQRFTAHLGVRRRRQVGALHAEQVVNGRRGYRRRMGLG
jgi:hypothetical protein